MASKTAKPAKAIHTVAKSAKPEMKATAKPAAAQKTAKSVTEDLIAQIAYRLWQDDGQPHGRDQDHWHRAVEIASAKKLIATKKAVANSDKAAPAKASKKRA
jgi:hypothetical protein